MNQSIEMTGKTVEEAVRAALLELGADQSEVNVEVLEEASGFLGLGQKATVRVTRKTIPEPEEISQTADEFTESRNESAELVSTPSDPETFESANIEDDESVPVENAMEKAEKEPVELSAAVEEIRNFLQDILKAFSMEDVNQVHVEEEDGRILASIEGEDCGILIGRKGDTLQSIQYLCSLIANKTSHARTHVALDIGGYKAKRENTVANLALRTAERAVRTGQAYELTPMTAAERRIVHEALQNYPGITTYSEGDEPNRYVVIDLAFEDEVFSDDEPV